MFQGFLKKILLLYALAEKGNDHSHTARSEPVKERSIVLHQNCKLYLIVAQLLLVQYIGQQEHEKLYIKK